MILRNYDNIMANKFFAYNTSSGITADGFIDGNPVIKLQDGTIRQTYTYTDGYGPLPFATSSGYSETKVIIGSGTTAVTYDDYKLENKITSISNDKITLGNIEFDNDTKRYKRHIVYDFMATEDITVNEIGATFQERNGTALIMRTVLEQPINVLAGTYGRVDFYINIQKA